MERSELRGGHPRTIPHSASLHAGYKRANARVGRVVVAGGCLERSCQERSPSCTVAAAVGAVTRQPGGNIWTNF
jgi:hypothetical protein